MTFTVWAKDDGGVTEFTIVEGDQPLPGDTSGMRAVKVIKAATWDEAAAKYIEWLGGLDPMGGE